MRFWRRREPERQIIRATIAVPDLTVVLPERKITGKRLGRHRHHDERSRAYPFTPRHTGTLVSVRHRRHVPPFNQGNLGSCTGNACAGALSTAPIDVTNKRVWITNSWGSSWGLAGRAWWSWDDLAKILADSGDATVLIR